MARQYEMTFEGQPAYRWVRMYKGVRYRVSCEELGAMVYTQEASYKLANAWWRNKLVALEGVPSRHATLIETLQKSIEGHKNDPLQPILEKIASTPEHERMSTIARMPEIDLLNCTKTTNKERTVKACAESFLASLTDQKPLTFREIRLYVRNNLVPYLGENTDVDSISAATVEKLALGLKKSSLSSGVQKKRYGFFSRFMEYLYTSEIIDRKPRNLEKFKFEVLTTEVKVYGNKEVRTVLASLTPRQRCYALLALNCGMTSADIGQLTKDMIQGNKLTRKRVKTESVKKVPTVTYTLWPETLELLAECQSNHDTLVLTTKDGTPLWESRLEEDGSTPQKDMIYQQWSKAEVSITFHSFRSIGANLVEEFADSDLASLYLGHSPKTVKDKHYTSPALVRLEAATNHIRTVLIEL